MRRPLLAAAVAVLLALPAPPARAGAPARTASRPAAAGRPTPGTGPARGSAAPARPPTLAEARAGLNALVQDRSKRRYRENWEKAIANLLRAARGKDAAAGLLDAARARYALYRWSANEADRDAALELANRSAKLGLRDAASLALAIRREAGDEKPAHAAPPAPATAAAGKRPAHPGAAQPAAPGPAPAPRPTPTPDPRNPDPELDAALGDLTLAPPRPLGDTAAPGPATVSEVRAWSSPEYTRVAIYLSHWVGWQKQELPAAAGAPRRLALDLRPAALAGPALVRPVDGEKVARVRAAQNDPETVRVVLDLAGSDAVQLFKLEDPPRLLLDVGEHPAAVAGAAAAATAAPPAPAPAGVNLAAPPGAAHPPERPVEKAALTVAPPAEPGEGSGRRPIRRIVVDAGHGGADPGAIGPSRVEEKAVTMAISRLLAARLRAEGFQVVLTRDGDRYMPLEERTALANTARGDLLVSVHANAHPLRSMSGVETYFLNVADDRYAARLAARENGVAAEGEGEVSRILTDLDATASAGASQRLAQLVQREVVGGVRSHVGAVQDLGVKSALFYVLLGARMPAVLVETAFISNGVEERRLTSRHYQEEVAAGICRAVVAFARAEAHVASR